MPTQPPGSYQSKDFINRELSLLAFNRRVFAMAEYSQTPALERLRYLCILSSNLDEFFEIRVAGLKEQLEAHSTVLSIDGKTPEETHRAVRAEVHTLVERQYKFFNKVLLPELESQDIYFLRRSDWNEAQQKWIEVFFRQELLPVLTPIGLDPAHPFPRVLNKSLNFIIELEGKDAFGRVGAVAIVQAPRVLPRVIRLPSEICKSEYTFVMLSSILHAFIGELFPSMTVHGCHQFRVTRNSDLFVDEEEVKNLRATIQGELPQRHFGNAVRLEVADTCPEPMWRFLLSQFKLNETDLYRVQGPVNLVRLMAVADQVDRPELKFPPYSQGLPKVLEKLEKNLYDIFAVIRKNDVLLHHPYQSFTPVIVLLQQAATDPQVAAIKITVYRTGTDSALMDSLILAAKNGKEVTVAVELLARFDEEANIGWATKLEEAGAHVIFGVVGYKTHAKMLMVVRREVDNSKVMMRRYVHLGTGNYHPGTTRFYSDFGLLSCNPNIGEDVSEIFQQLTGLGKPQPLLHLLQAPFTLHTKILEAINSEAEIARSGKPASIIAKMNSLLEPQIIAALYDASRAGVKIQLIVRGVCALRPGVPKLSENIHVRSIIGRYLEHHRIFLFNANGAKNLWLSSADWMERNFFRRVETAFPILDPKLKRRVIQEGLRSLLSDNCQAWNMDKEGKYRLARHRTKGERCAQTELMKSLGHLHQTAYPSKTAQK